MGGPTIWIDRPCDIEPDGEGFKITSYSGSDSRTEHFSRHLLRRLVEESRRALDRAEAENCVIGLRDYNVAS